MPSFPDNLKPADPQGPDCLARERAGSSLPVQELAKHLFGRDGFLERQERILQELQKEPVFSKESQQHLSRKERFELGLTRAKCLRRMADKHRWDQDDYLMALYLVDDVNPFYAHTKLFTNTIREQASDEQLAYWMPKIESWEVTGGYAQTELGHGSNVRGLELEAKWDPATRQFILNSPTLTSSKWWNGSLGITGNHAIVVAQLMLPTKSDTKSGELSGKTTSYTSYGPHTFVVQVRAFKTHKPMKGVVIGDIGPKYGYITMDNAYVLFDNYRIPHSALLSRHAKVDPDTGAYSKPKVRALIYGSMTFSRSVIVMQARMVLARAVTIAIRYSAIRHQFSDRDGGPNSPEVPVLDYQTVQIRVLPLLATMFALHYSGQAMGDLFYRTRTSINSGDFSELADLHNMSTGLKSLCTGLAADGIETCRRVLGGHGFGGGSGMIQLNNDYLSKPTVEGDNWMITQQVAAYLIKKMTAVAKDPDGNSTDSTEDNLRNFVKARTVPQHLPQCAGPFDVLKSDQALVDAFQWRAAALTFRAYEARVVRNEKWNSILIQLHKLGLAQSQARVVGLFYSAVEKAGDMSSELRGVLRDLFRLFCLYTMDNEAREFLSTGAISTEHMEAIPEEIKSLLVRIRPHAVKLVDAWMIPDYLLDSALGRSDGKVYEDLFNRAHRLNPLNKITYNPRYWDDELVMGAEDYDRGELLSKL